MNVWLLTGIGLPTVPRNSSMLLAGSLCSPHFVFLGPQRLVPLGGRREDVGVGEGAQAQGGQFDVRTEEMCAVTRPAYLHDGFQG